MAQPPNWTEHEPTQPHRAIDPVAWGPGHGSEEPSEPAKRVSLWDQMPTWVPVALAMILAFLFGTRCGSDGDNSPAQSESGSEAPPATIAPEVVAQTADASGVKTGSRNTENPPPYDVTLGRCDVTENGLDVEVVIHNHSSETSNYEIKVLLADTVGMRLGEETVKVKDVKAGQTVRRSVAPADDRSPDATECVLMEVDRHES